MSAIFGIINRNGKDVRKAHLKMMQERLQPYGPDEQEIYIRRNAGLGCCYRTITENQNHTPVIHTICNNQKVTMVIDSYLSTEKFVQAIRQQGHTFHEQLSREFCVAYWHHGDQCLHLFRDHLGLRPMYYYEDSDLLVFATDYRAILDLPFIPVRIDENRVFEKMVYHYTQDKEKTFFKGICKLPAASSLFLDKTGITCKEYWTPRLDIDYGLSTKDDYYAYCNELIHHKIQEQVAKGYKIGSELSSGLDSSVISIVAGKYVTDNKEFHVFSWAPDFNGLKQQEDDERLVLNEIADTHNFELHYHNRSIEQFKKDLDAIVPVECNIMFPILNTARKARRYNCDLLLSGWGGDQGISFRANLAFFLKTSGVKRCMKEMGRGNGPVQLIKLSAIVAKSLYFDFIRIPITKFIRFRHGLYYLRENRLKVLKAMLKLTIEANWYNTDRVRHLKKGNIEERAAKSSWIGAMYNLDYLYPFLDKDIIEFSLNVPAELHRSNGANRHLLRYAFKRELTEERISRLSKNEDALLKSVNTIKDRCAESCELLAILIQMIDKKRFQSYLDFKKIEYDIGRGNINRERHDYLFLRLLTLYNIQKIVDDLK